MTQKILYRFKRADGGITHSLKKPNEAGYNKLYRLIADDGKMLTIDGENLSPVVDVENAEGWYEVDAPEEILL